MEISKKDKKYLIASGILIFLVVVSISIFAAQEVDKTKYGTGRTSAKSSEVELEEVGEAEVLEMERLSSFGRNQKQKEEVVVVNNKSEAEQVVIEMDSIMNSIGERISN